MAETKYTYSVANDFPGGAVNTSKLHKEILNSAITVAIARVDQIGDVLDIVFKDALPAADKTVLDGDTAGPAGGLIAAHDNSPTEEEAQTVKTGKAVLTVMPKPRDIGGRLWVFSQNFCDKTTWFYQSAHVAEKSLGLGDGLLTVFSMGDTDLIDVTHGKISEEDSLDPSKYGHPGISSYAPVVKVDGVVQTEREFDKGSGGDYEIDYATGTLTFYTPPALNADVRVSYFKAQGGRFAVHPSPNKVFVVEEVELQFTKDMVMTDTVFAEVWVYNPNDLPNKVLYGGSRGTFKTLHDFINWSKGSFPPITQFGGTGPRALKDDIYHLRVHYRSPILLPYSAGAELRIDLKDDIPFGGSYGAVTYYGIEEDE